MKNLYKAAASMILLPGAALITAPVSAAVIEFHFTGQYTLVDPAGLPMEQQPIESTLTYNSNSGVGSSPELAISNFDTFGNTATIYDISLEHVTGTNFIIGNMLVDWNFSFGLPVSMVWDASGLINAIDFGLEAGDIISGTDLKRNGTSIFDVGSAIPASDGLSSTALGTLNQGPAPLAVTTLNTATLCSPGSDCIGNALSGGAPFTDDGIAGSPMIDGPFPGLNVNFDIGSGNSLTVVSVREVPVPGAIWLFGSGLLGMIGIARRRKNGAR